MPPMQPSEATAFSPATAVSLAPPHRRRLSRATRCDQQRHQDSLGIRSSHHNIGL